METWSKVVGMVMLVLAFADCLYLANKRCPINQTHGLLGLLFGFIVVFDAIIGLFFYEDAQASYDILTGGICVGLLVVGIPSAKAFSWFRWLFIIAIIGIIVGNILMDIING